MSPQLVAHSILDTGLAAPSDRFSLFRAALGVSHDCEDLSAGSFFEARLDAWMIGGMMVTAGHQGPSRIWRDDQRVRSDGLDHITFMHLLYGATTGEATRPVRCCAGETLVLDTAATMDVTTTANRNIGVRLPRSALVGAGIDTSQLNGLVLAGAIGRVVGDHFSALVRHASLITIADAGILQRATVAFLRECLNGNDQDRADVTSVEVRRRAADYIERVLADPTLSGERVANATGISRSVLYRAFPGGISRYLSGRRLDRAFALLSDPGEPRSVADIGFAVGYTDASHFSTAFRKRFGASASDVRRSGPAAAHNGLPDAYQLWLAALSAKRAPQIAALQPRRDVQATIRDAGE